jgi:hypothetical protein
MMGVSGTGKAWYLAGRILPRPHHGNTVNDVGRWSDAAPWISYRWGWIGPRVRRSHDR